MTSETSQGELLTVDEAAALKRATARQIRARIKAGQLPAIRPAGARSYLIAISDLDRCYAPTLRQPAPQKRTSPAARERDQLAKAGFAT